MPAAFALMDAYTARTRMDERLKGGREDAVQAENAALRLQLEAQERAAEAQERAAAEARAQLEAQERAAVEARLALEAELEVQKRTAAASRDIFIDMCIEMVYTCV